MLNKLFAEESSSSSSSLSGGMSESDFMIIGRLLLQLVAGSGVGSGSGNMSGTNHGFDNGVDQNMAKVYRPDYYFQ